MCVCKILLFKHNYLNDRTLRSIYTITFI